MASFSFSTGNVAKLLRVPLYAAGWLATRLIPRDRDRWVFGSAAGLADGAFLLWRRAAADGHRMVWLASSAAEQSDARGAGIPAIRKTSFRGFWCTARAGVVVVTHGFGDVNRYAVAGAFIVQLWHGIPLKRIGLDSAETVRLPEAVRAAPGGRLLHAILVRAYRATTRQIGLIPAASHVVRARLESAFSLPDDRVAVTGEPRTDVLCQGTAAGRRADARAALHTLVGPLPGSARLVLYAPTWRDGEADPAAPDDETWRVLDDVLRRQDAVLLLRSHPLGAGAQVRACARVRTLGVDVAPDIMPLLPAFDALVTDYSSIAFDAALVPIPTVFFAPDLDEYAARRGLYGTYDDVTGGDWATDWPGVAERLDSLLGSSETRRRLTRRAQTLSTDVHAFADGGSTGRVYSAVMLRSRRHGQRRRGCVR